MLAFIQVFFIALGVSFLGQLPLGNMNMIATQVSVQEGVKSAWRFGVGVAIVEIIYLRVALSGIDWVLTHEMLFRVLAWATVVFLRGLGVATLIKAKKQKPTERGIIVDNKFNRFLLGVSLSALNPIQIPFWFTWIITLVNNGLLLPGNANYNLFTLGAGVGTLFGIGVYIHGGKWAFKKSGKNNKSLNYVLGVVFIIAALIQMYKNIFSPWKMG